MTLKAAKKSTARLGRPALKPGSPKRSSFNTRLRAETKEELEAQAVKSGRSLSEEIEFRLEQSLRDENTLVESLGGKDTYEVLKLFGAVAAVIQTKTGKPTTDWKTGAAISRAWKQQILNWVPGLPAEWIAELHALPDNIPDAPVPPERYAGGFKPGGPQSPEEWAAYHASWDAFNAENDIYLKAIKACRAAMNEKTAEANSAGQVGMEALEDLGLLNSQEK
jgi:hypothetical protein